MCTIHAWDSTTFSAEKTRRNNKHTTTYLLHTIFFNNKGEENDVKNAIGLIIIIIKRDLVCNRTCPLKWTISSHDN